MDIPVNRFGQALREGRAQIGLWVNQTDPVNVEICAGAGFDWLLFDAEHSPNDMQRLMVAAQVAAAYPATQAIARIPGSQSPLAEVLIKQVLDTGIQTVLVPMVDTPEQAAMLARAMRYPEAGGGGGIRGMAGARASRWGRVADYARRANEQVCLLVQAETRAALAHLDAIAATEGVDGVFIGPADLSASMGYPGQSGHPEVQTAIEQAITRIRAAGKAPGILTTDEADARRYLALGALFVAVGLDTNLLARATSQLAATFKADAAAAPAGRTY